MDFKNKYLKYKKKYFDLKKQHAGMFNKNNNIYFLFKLNNEAEKTKE